MIYHMYYRICKWQRCSLVFLFLLIAGFASAQFESFELRGVVLDCVRHLPISNVTIAFLGKNAVVSTGAQGQFLIKDVQLKDQLVLTSVGFDRKTVHVTSTNRMIILQPSSSSNLDEVTVVAYGAQKKIQQAMVHADVKSDGVHFEIKEKVTVNMGMLVNFQPDHYMKINAFQINLQ